jgi:hypothetical protein
MRWDVDTERVNDGVKQLFSEAGGACLVERGLAPSKGNGVVADELFGYLSAKNIISAEAD